MPVMTVDERKIILEGLRYVDEVISYATEEDLYKLLVELNPDIRIMGADWFGKRYTGRDLPMKIHFNDRKKDYSTSKLRERVYEAELARLKEAGPAPASAIDPLQLNLI